jgi:hypothetical protein
MLKAFCLTVVLSTALMPFLAEMALGSPLPKSSINSGVPSAESTSMRSQPIGSQQPVVPNDSDPDQPVCYMHTADGRVLNLASLCEQKSEQEQLQDNSLQDYSNP